MDYHLEDKDPQSSQFLFVNLLLLRFTGKAQSIISLTPSALTNCKYIREMYIPSLNSCDTDIEKLVNLIGHQVKITINL